MGQFLKKLPGGGVLNEQATTTSDMVSQSGKIQG